MKEETPMQAKAGPAAGFNGVAVGNPGVPTTSVRVLYPDLHGVARGKDIPISEFDILLKYWTTDSAACASGGVHPGFTTVEEWGTP